MSRSLRLDTDRLDLQTKTVVDTMTATITQDHTQLQTLTQVATQTQTLTETSVVAETALAECLGKCQPQWGLSSGNGDMYNTYATAMPSYTLTTTAAGSHATQSPPYMSSDAMMSSHMNGASAVSSASLASSAPPVSSASLASSAPPVSSASLASSAPPMSSASVVSSAAPAGASTTTCAGCSD